jgi:flavodoxin
MKSLVVYETGYGNTERLARAIAEALHEQGEARVSPVGGVSGLRAGEVDLLVVGAPTHSHGLTDGMREMLEGIPKGALRGMRALAFDTRYRGPRLVRGSAAKEIAGLLRHLGCRLLASPESFFVKGEEGPLEPGEEYRAKAWALHALGRPEEVSTGGGR